MTIDNKFMISQTPAINPQQVYSQGKISCDGA